MDFMKYILSLCFFWILFYWRIYCFELYNAKIHQIEIVRICGCFVTWEIV